MRCVKEDKAALWGKGAVSKKSSHKHEGIDDVVYYK